MDITSLAGLIVMVVFLLLYGLEAITGGLTASSRPLRDGLFTLSGMFSQFVLNGMIVGTVAGYLVVLMFPNGAGQLQDTPFWLGYLGLFFCNEMAHYWLHRAAHEWRWLWKLHRTHHSAEKMNVGVLYRYNVFWVMMLPQVWFGMLAVYSGMTGAFLAASMTTFFVNLLTHTSWRWDLWLREKMPWSETLWWLIERTITLPDTHHAHHAYGKAAHPNGNYAVTVFLFDIIFGTAKIPHQRQEKFGLPISPRLPWQEELFWPVIKRPLLAKPPKVEI